MPVVPLPADQRERGSLPTRLLRMALQEVTRFQASVGLAVRMIRAHKVRSLLTLLGIIIGVLSVVVMKGIGVGLERYVEQEFAQMGSNVLYVWAGKLESGRLAERVKEPQPIRPKEVEAIRRYAPSVTLVAPVIEQRALARRANRGLTIRVLGVTPEYELVQGSELAEGEFISEEDVAGARRVAVVGQDVKEKIFLNRDPIGKTFKIQGISYRVIGVLKPIRAERGHWVNPNAVALIPVTTAQRRFRRGEIKYDYLILQARSFREINRAEEEIRSALRRARNLHPSQDDDFTILNTGDIIRRVKRIVVSFNLVFGAIAFLALLTGGIGIMNIMLVSVTERTREIGIRKALGARRRDILYQFLTEAVVLSLLGGVLGAALAYGVIRALRQVKPLVQAMGAPVFSPEVLSVALLVSILVGIVFGLWPAWRAASLKPVEALRYE